MQTIVHYYSEPHLLQLYKETVTKYELTDRLEKDFGKGFEWLKKGLPSLPVPEIFLHVSGFNQNVLVANGLLSISIDKYMGKDYPLYQNYFFDYQRTTMIPEMIVPDGIIGWCMSEYLFEGKENVLLDRMIYEGKMLFLVHHAFPQISMETLLGYSNASMNWCLSHESSIWKEIIQRKHLYTPDQSVTDKYFTPAPSQFLSQEAPGNLGRWIGWRIVEQYMNNSQANLTDLMTNNDSQQILTLSKYKP